MSPQRILAVCLRGNSRSAAMAWVLKEEFERDAVCIGWSAAGPELMDTLCRWAEVVVVMEGKFAKHIPAAYAEKIKVCDVGDDRWVNPRHPELQELCRNFAAKELK
jgi:predicted protein tyrosine phosphatase